MARAHYEDPLCLAARWPARRGDMAHGSEPLFILLHEMIGQSVLTSEGQSTRALVECSDMNGVRASQQMVV